MMGGRVFRNNYKGHMDITKSGCHQGWKVGLGSAGSGGGKMKTTILEQQ